MVASTPRPSLALRGLAFGAVALMLFSACSSSSSSPSAAAGASAASAAPAVPPKYTSGPAAPGDLGATTIRSNEHEAVPASSVKAMVDYCTNKAGVQATVSTSVHNDFQDQFNSFMQATPDDIVKWFTGERLRFPARNGLLTPIDDVWQTIAANYTDGMAKASQGDDGKKYAVPIVSYPWVVLYRKSLFQEKGYTVPKTWDEFVTLAKKIQADGLIPLAFADKDGWPAMGTFDILNMRMNGYQFHADLLAGKQKWTDPKVQAVFEKWAELLPYTQPDPLGRTWQEGAQTWANNKAAMYFLGTFASQQVPAENLADVDFFPFPTLGTQYDAELGIDAPVDAWILSKAPKNLPAAKALLACFATPGGAVGLPRQGPQPDPGSEGHGHELVHPAADQDGRDHRGVRWCRPVPRPRYSLRLRRGAGHAGTPAGLHQEPVAGPGRLHGQDPGRLRLASSTVIR